MVSVDELATERWVVLTPSLIKNKLGLKDGR
jgi:hypothetical protein